MHVRTALALSLFVLLPAFAVAADVPNERLVLHELWERGSDDDELFFGNIDRIVGDEAGNAYALDTQLSEVLVFSPDGEHLRTIGGRGEGPGEFNQAADLFYGLGGKVGVLQAFPGKIIQLEPSGVPLDNFRLPELPGGGFQVVLRASALDDRLVLAGNRQARSGGQNMQKQYLEAYTAEGERIVQFHEEEHEFRFGGMEYEEPVFVSFVRRWDLAPDGWVAAPLDFHDYAIHLWRPDGTLERVIRREDYETLERTDAEREITQQLFDAVTSFNPRSSFEISDAHPAIAQVFARADGELWVLSGRGIYRAPDGAAFVLDVFDREGQFLRQMEVSGDLDLQEDAIYLVGDRIYAVTGALGAAMSALGGGEAETGGGPVEPSTLVCFELRPAP